MRPFNWMSKCQNLTLSEQLDAGVRCLDLRIRWKGDGFVFCHGLTEYESDVYRDVYDVLDFIRWEFIYRNTQLYVRLSYEGTSCPEFAELCDHVSRRYGEIRFQFCTRDNGWTILEDGFGIRFQEIQDSPDSILEIIKGPHGLLNHQWERLKPHKDAGYIVSMDFVDEYLELRKSAF